ncbi:hypothetical protein SALBM311S_03506 [Streptomyces alboniger]
MPKNAPRGRAITMASAAAFSVLARPGSRYVVQACDWVNGFHRADVSWFFSSIVCQTHHRSRASRTKNTTEKSTLRRLARGPGVS